MQHVRFRITYSTEREQVTCDIRRNVLYSESIFQNATLGTSQILGRSAWSTLTFHLGNKPELQNVCTGPARGRAYSTYATKTDANPHKRTIDGPRNKALLATPASVALSSSLVVSSIVVSST